ncbi:hypothetical protein Dsin_029270 [Dipteronia sinensis]|uniref:Uncharacterized protein n=1 Tax=Dipteronia sinensis TaxID=43782 RepID=A0AAD9ZSH9_9ROSI|nr:hypothetical protein Dsin_029270 [Dipteronia sinensis]
MVFPWSKDFLHEYQLANDPCGGMEVAASIETLKWRPSAKGVYKINMVAALAEGKNVMGVSTVIRNHFGFGHGIYCSMLGDRFWMKTFPSCVERFIQDDCPD